MELRDSNKASLYSTATKEFYCDSCDSPAGQRCMGRDPCPNRISKCLDVYGTDHFQEDWIMKQNDTTD